MSEVLIREKVKYFSLSEENKYTDSTENRIPNNNTDPNGVIGIALCPLRTICSGCSIKAYQSGQIPRLSW